MISLNLQSDVGITKYTDVVGTGGDDLKVRHVSLMRTSGPLWGSDMVSLISSPTHARPDVCIVPTHTHRQEVRASRAGPNKSGDRDRKTSSRPPMGRPTVEAQLAIERRFIRDTIAANLKSSSLLEVEEITI